MDFMSLLSDSYLLVLPLIVLYLGQQKKEKAFALVVSLLLVLVIVTAIKWVVAEPRPCSFVAGCPPNEAPFESFPSRHAALVAAPILFLLAEWPILLGYSAYALLISFSRVILGVHYPHDVFAGALIGLAIGYVCLKFNKKLFHLANRVSKRPSRRD